MPVTQQDLDWFAARLLPEIYDINQEFRQRAKRERLESLYRELMKFRFTENTFFLGKERKAGEELTAEAPPYRIEPGTGKRIAQFVELPEQIATPVTEETNQTIPPPVTMVAAPVAPAKPPAGSFAVSIKAIMDTAKASFEQAQAAGLAKVQAAASKYGDVAAATTKVTDNMAKTIEDGVASAMADLGQISNLPPDEI